MGLVAEVLPDPVNSVSVPEGAVALQSPATGEARRGTVVELTLSAGPRILRVPNVFSNSEEDAVAALEAAVNPEEGDWLYFVTVDFDTGETKFGSNAAEHERNVKEFQAWCQAKPGRCDS